MAENLFRLVKERASITEVVEHFGGLRLDRNHKALCPFHSEKTPSFSVDEKVGVWNCFGSCGGKGGDVISFVAKIKDIKPLEAAKLIAEFYGIDTQTHGGKRSVERKPVPEFKTRPEANLDAPDEITAEQRKRNADYIRVCTADRGADGYLKSRGFTEETIKRFCLGYDRERDAAIIPYSSAFAYYTARLINPPPKVRPHQKPPKETWGAQPIYNEAAIGRGGAVFVVESQLCAISIMQAGGVAVALGGLGYIGLLLRTIAAKDKDRKCVYIISLDNDEHGREAKPKLVDGLKKLGARFIEYMVSGDDENIKDPNALLQTDAAALITNVEAAIEEAKGVEEKPKFIDKEKAVKALLAEDLTDAAAVFKAEFIDALVYAKEHIPAEYALFKIKAKVAKVPLRDLENTVSQRLRKQRSQGAGDELPLDLGRSDLNGAVAPKGWTVTLEDGVRKLVTTRDSEHEVVACPDAVIITARFANADDGKERVELSFFRDGTWKTVMGARTQVYNKAAIIAFGDYGLHITSETARDLVQYLSEYEISNIKAIPLKKSIARIGWIGATQFFPFATDEEITFEDSVGAVVYYNLREQGDYAAWKDMMTELRKNAFARFLTAASFTSPLLVKMGVRPFAIHIWYDSASGKSAVLKAAVSIWGSEKLLGSAFATVVGIEQRAGMLNHLPLAIDEKQAADENKMPLPRLIYMLGEGEGKTRGAKGGGTQETVTWHNLAIITGEEPITSSSTSDGVQTRTLELNGRPVDDKEFAQLVHKNTEVNFGYAGAAFMRAICERLKSEPDFLEKKYVEVYAALKAKGLKGVHAEYIAAVIVGDALAETLIFGKDAEAAEKESFENGIAIFKHNEEQLQTDVIRSAYSFVVGWIASNEGRFAENAFTSPIYGKKVDGGEYRSTYYVIPLYLEKALEEAGYNVEKITRGFWDKGFITPYNDANGVRRKKYQITINGVKADMYRFDLVKKDKPPRQATFADLTHAESEDLPF